ncbi:MAG: DUF1422 family protein [Psychromonas sp.]
MSENPISVKWLTYSFIIGLSASAVFSILTIDQVKFSAFVFFSLFFSVNHFYRMYVKEGESESNIRPAWAAFFIGFFSYSAYICTMYPELGSNIISVLISISLVIWLMYKLMFGDKPYSA